MLGFVEQLPEAPELAAAKISHIPKHRITLQSSSSVLVLSTPRDDGNTHQAANGIRPVTPSFVQTTSKELADVSQPARAASSAYLCVFATSEQAAPAPLVAGASVSRATTSWLGVTVTATCLPASACSTDRHWRVCLACEVSNLDSHLDARVASVPFPSTTTILRDPIGVKSTQMFVIKFRDVCYSNQTQMPGSSLR